MEQGNEAGLKDIRRYEDILAKDPGSFCFAPLSDLYRRMGRLDEALDTALRGCEMHPDYIGGYMALGRACFEKGLYEESRQALEKVVRAMPDNALARQLLDQIPETLAEDAGTEAWVFETADGEVAAPPVSSPSYGDSVASEEFQVEWAEGLSSEYSAEPGIGADDEDIIELTDEVVEEEEVLWQQQYEEAEEPEVPASEPAELQASPLSTGTIADLYLSQGFPDKALDIYRELLKGDPDNIELRQQVETIQRMLAGEQQSDAAELPGTPAAAAAMPVDEMHERQASAAEQPSVLETLEGWLANIRRLR